MISGEDADVHLVEHTHEVEEDAVGIDEGAGRVNATRPRKRTLVAPVLLDVRDVELEFWADNGLKSERVVFPDDFFEDGSWRNEVRRTVGVEGISNGVGDTRLEGVSGSIELTRSCSPSEAMFTASRTSPPVVVTHTP
jgi:hypothetical protein